MYVRKRDNNRVFWKGIVRAGDRVPAAVAAANPGMFEWVETRHEEETAVAPPPAPSAPPPPTVDSAWTMTEADLDDSGDLDAVDPVGSEEPFEGYDEMSVRRITEVLRDMDLSAEELLYVREYEMAHKGRSTMLREIDEMGATVSEKE